MLRLLMLFTAAIMADVGIYATVQGPPCWSPGNSAQPGIRDCDSGCPSGLAPGSHPDCPCLPSLPGVQHKDIYGCPCQNYPVSAQPGRPGGEPEVEQPGKIFIRLLLTNPQSTLFPKAMWGPPCDAVCGASVKQ